MAELVDEDCLSVIAIGCLIEQVLLGRDHVLPSDPARAGIPVLAIGQRSDARIVVFELAAGQAWIVPCRFAPVAHLGQIEQRLVLRHHRDTVTAFGQHLCQIRTVGKHALGHRPRCGERLGRNPHRGDDRDASRRRVLGVVWIEPERFGWRRGASAGCEQCGGKYEERGLHTLALDAAA